MVRTTFIRATPPVRDPDLIKDSRAYPDYSAQRLVAGAFTVTLSAAASALSLLFGAVRCVAYNRGSSLARGHSSGMPQKAHYSLHAALLAAVLTTPASAALRDYPFWVEVVPFAGSDGYVAVAQNHGPSPVTVSATLVPGKSSPPWPILIVVPARSRVTLTTIANLGVAHVSESHRIGDSRATHSNDATYRLPFGDQDRHRVARAPDSVDTGWDTPLARHGVAFVMAAGETVSAARAGVVVDIPGGPASPSQPLLYESNSVTILHSDGTYAWYGPLRQGSSQLTSGRAVRAGEVVGAAQGPLLYFFVLRTVDGTTVVSEAPAFYATVSRSAIALTHGAAVSPADGVLNAPPNWVSPYPLLPPVLGNGGENRAIGITAAVVTPSSTPPPPTETRKGRGSRGEKPLIELPPLAWEGAAGDAAASELTVRAGKPGVVPGVKRPEVGPGDDDFTPRGFNAALVPLWSFAVFAVAHLIAVEVIKRVFRRPQKAKPKTTARPPRNGAKR